MRGKEEKEERSRNCHRHVVMVWWGTHKKAGIMQSEQRKTGANGPKSHSRYACIISQTFSLLSHTSFKYVKNSVAGKDEFFALQSQKIKARLKNWGHFSTLKDKAGTLCGFVTLIQAYFWLLSQKLKWAFIFWDCRANDWLRGSFPLPKGELFWQDDHISITINGRRKT